MGNISESQSKTKTGYQSKIIEAIAASPEVGEQLNAIGLGIHQVSGMWFALFGQLAHAQHRNYLIGVTNKRVIFIRQSIRGVSDEAPKFYAAGQVRVIKLKKGILSRNLWLALPDNSTLKLQFPITQEKWLPSQSVIDALQAQSKIAIDSEQ